MASVNLRSLISKLNAPCREALESAAGLTLSRTHYNIEVEHWLLKLLENPTLDLAAIFSQYEVDQGRMISDFNRVLDKIKTGNARAPAISPSVVKLVREAWIVASLEYGAPQVRTGHLLVAMLGDDDLAMMAREASSQFSKIPIETLKRELVSITAKSAEAAQAASSADTAGGPATDARGVPQSRGTGSLDQFCTDLTAAARAGKIDPVLGRDPEIRQIIDILTRRRQNNPILTGEAGVGKTAVVEGFALRVAAGDVPEALKKIRLLSLDLGLLQAGAGVKGEFENRLKSVIQEVKDSPTPIIMFIDEAHTLIGAGGAEGQNDAANLLKPALARGEMRTIAATTWAEYKKYFEKDPALTRRFQVVKVEEPSEDLAIRMMNGLSAVLEKHHSVRILNEALEAAVHLSHRYISGRQLPDKAISLLDTACARVAMSQSTTPPSVEDLERRITDMKTKIDILTRESVTGANHSAAIAELDASLAGVDADLVKLSERWRAEQGLVAKVNGLRVQVEAGGEGAAAARPELDSCEAELRTLQGETPLIFDRVDRNSVAEVLAGWTGIPVGRMVSNEIRTVLTIQDRMRERIKGQDHALFAIAQAMQTSRAKLTDPRKPIGVFLMCGTSGVGKTETALTLASLLYGGEQNMTTINMSEFKEEHKVSLLLGSPPGYVGYGEGGVLTEAVRRKPYSIVLLDEMEKAHPGVQDIFFQVFDKGMLKDGQGRDIDFKNTMIIMTSNAGTDTIEKLWADPETMPDAAGLGEMLRPELLKFFKPAFLGRVTMVPFFPLSPEIIKEIVVINMNRISERVKLNYGASFNWTPEVVDFITKQCTENQSGARNIENILKRSMVPDLATLFLEKMADGEQISQVSVSVSDDGVFNYDLTDA